MIKYLNLSAVALLILAFGCSKEKETPNGMKYTVVTKGDGVLPKKDDVLVFDYMMKDSKDSVWASTFEDGVQVASMVGDSAAMAKEDGMTQMFRMLSKGDSVTTTMTVKKFFKDLVHSPIPPKVDSTRSITYAVAVREITNLENYMKNRQAQVMERDGKVIEKYLADNKLTAQRDTSGLQYIIHNSNGGQKPTVESCVEVKYRGRFMKTGRIFDQQDRIGFPLGGVINGWKFGIPLLGKGDSATFFIPSKLGYGPEGYPGAIPPDAVLMFDVTLLDVKSQFDPQTRSCK